MLCCRKVKFVVTIVVILASSIFNTCIGHLHVMQGHCQESPGQILSLPSLGQYGEAWVLPLFVGRQIFFILLAH